MRQFTSQIGTMALLLVVLAVGAGVGSAVAASDGTASGSGGVTVSLEPADSTVTAGGQTTYDVVVDGASEGIGTYTFTLEVSDSSVVTAESYTNANTPMFNDKTVNGSHVEVSAAMGDNTIPGAQQITLGTVTLAGESEGQANISFVGQTGTSNVTATPYTVDAATGASVEVVNEIDLSLAPAQQTVSAGETTTYDLVAEGATEGISSYEANLSLSDSSVASFQSFDHAYQPKFDNTEVTDNRLDIGAALGDNIIPGAQQTTLGTVTLAGETGGQANISFDETSLVLNSNAEAYGVGTMSGGSVEVINDINISLSPAQQTVSVSGTTTYELVAEGATGGIGSYEATLSFSDGSVASFQSFDHAYQPKFDNTQVTDNEVSIGAAMGGNVIPGAQQITLGTLTVAGEAEGQTDISAGEVFVLNANAEAYANGTVVGGALEVDSETAAVDLVPQDNRVRAGSQATFDVVVDAPSGIGAYETQFELATDRATFADYELTASGDEGPLDDSSISADGSSLMLDAALLDAAHGPGETVVATLTLDVDSPGPVRVTTTEASLLDAGGQAYRTTVDEASVTAVGPPAVLPGNEPADPDDDGLYEDVRGDGGVSVLDVQTLFVDLDTPAVQQNAAFYNFADADADTVTVLDVQTLFDGIDS